MAVLQNSKKLRTYHSLYQINRAFRAIAFHVRILEDTGLFPIFKMRVLTGLTRELQAQISHDVVDRMHQVEDREMYRWGKVRNAREKYLRGPEPKQCQQR